MADERGDSRPSKWDRFREGPNQSKPLWKVFRDIILAPVKWFLYFFGNIIAIILMILLIFGAGFFTYNYAQTGTLQLQKTQLTDTLSKIPIIVPLLDTLKIIQDPSRVVRQSSWQTEVDRNSENQELGLIFKEFKSIKEIYRQDEIIALVARAQITSLKDNAQVKFSCKETTKEIMGVVNPPEPITLPKDSTQVLSVRCEIPAGSIKLEDQQIAPARIVLNADYDFKSSAYIEAYTMSSNALRELQNNLINPFENENNPRLNKETGELRSVTENGPMILSLGIIESQPLTDQGPYLNNPHYTLGLEIKKSGLSYQGLLNKINNVYIYLPKDFEFQDFGELNEFEIISENEDEIFNKYKMKEAKIEDLNKRCRDKISLLDIKCQDYWERGFIITITNFKIASLNKEDLDKNFIRAEVEYEFQAQTSKVVKVAESFAT
ncbi:MAG: hypothetical protein AABW45_01040 [Nanoarchaeota archaeon]